MNYIEIVKECRSISDFCKKLGLSNGGGGFNKAKKIIKDNNLSIEHFDRGIDKRIKNEIVYKDCPVCGKNFKTQKIKKEKVTCSYSCSNTFFRSGDNNGNWSEDAYRSTCFLYHKKECVVCKESNIVEVHHMDENKHNNNYENLIPLCPTHHQYWHSRYKYLVEDKIYNYIKDKKQ